METTPAEQTQLAAGRAKPASTDGLVIGRRAGLSPREKQVLDLLAGGFSYREIGERLTIGPVTVRTHVKHICQKMQVRNRLEAVAKHARRLDVQREAEQYPPVVVGKSAAAASARGEMY